MITEGDTKTNVKDLSGLGERPNTNPPAMCARIDLQKIKNILEEFAKNTVELDPKVNKAVNDRFWDLFDESKYLYKETLNKNGFRYL